MYTTVQVRFEFGKFAYAALTNFYYGTRFCVWLRQAFSLYRHFRVWDFI